jgi:hypothetical protein
VEAEINFGAGGATQIVKIDWVQGAQISLPMNAVTVFATYNIDALSAPQPPGDLRLSVMLGKGPALGKSQWTDPTPLSLVPGGQTPPARIPAFASRIDVLGTDSAGTDQTFTASNFLIFLGGPLTGDRQIVSVRLDQYLNAIGEGIVIPSQAKYATLFDLFGDVANAQARFQYDIFWPNKRAPIVRRTRNSKCGRSEHASMKHEREATNLSSRAQGRKAARPQGALRPSMPASSR